MDYHAKFSVSSYWQDHLFYSRRVGVKGSEAVKNQKSVCSWACDSLKSHSSLALVGVCNAS